MGMNYYAITDKCACCGRHERRHVGKSYRTLRAYGTELTSWQDWLKWFGAVQPQILDEDGYEVPLTEFIARWKPREESAAIAKRNNEDWWNAFGTVLGDYVDDEGYLFCRREFS